MKSRYRIEKLRRGLVVLTLGVLSAASGGARAATVTRTISTSAQLTQLFTDANANPSNSYVGNLTATTLVPADTLNLTKGSVTLQGASSLAQAGSYVIDCQNQCAVGSSQGQVFRVRRASGYAGTLYLKLTGVTVTGGWSVDASLRGGGGVLVENGTLEVSYSIIRNNKANQWGAGLLAVAGANMFLTGSIVRDNENDQIGVCGNGDTAFAGGVGVIDATATITGSSITSNKACKGAGVAAWGTSSGSIGLSIANSTIGGNTANYHGGGLLLRGNTKYAHVSFSTIAFNKAGTANDSGDFKYGGGIGFRDVTVVAGGQAPAIRIYGTILAKNTLGDIATTIGQDCFVAGNGNLAASHVGVASNFVGKIGLCSDILGWTSIFGGSTFVGVESKGLDPLLGPLSGGTSAPLAYQPLSNSPVLSEYTGGNRSRNLAATSCPGIDIARQNRGSGPVFPTHCDIGAYETSTCFSTTFTPMTLAPGWTASGWAGPPATAVDCENQLIFKGAVQTSGSDNVVAWLPFTAPSYVYLPINIFAARKGRLEIEPASGQMTVWPEFNSSDTYAFTSLDGPSYALDATGFYPLTLATGWSNAPYNTRNAAYSTAGGMVRLQGAISTTGTNMKAFTLPLGARPSVNLYIPVDLCGSVKGRLIINATGDVTVHPYNGAVWAAQCFVSLEGVWFSISGTGYTTASLQNGWTHAPFSTRSAAYSVERGMVRFQGAVANPSSTASTTVFTLPAGARPSNTVWIPVNTCGGAGGRLDIFSDGTVKVEAETSPGDATCFTSLEGVRFAL
jgi:hypothetical protein